MTKTWQDIEIDFQENLHQLYDKDEIKELFLMSIEHTAAISKSKYILQKNEKPSVEQLQELQNIVQELSTGRPIQHIIAAAHFYGNVFEVNEHTLIPRPETEELLHMILQDHSNDSNKKIIDIGTGSGCIPISLAIKLPQNEFWAVDISTEALAVARRNASRLHTAVNFINADILEWEYIFDQAQRFDIIVSNPPYITPKEKDEMHRNVLAFEPHTALFIEEEAPLLFYDHIADFAKQHLQQDGTLYFEINQYLGAETQSLLFKKGFKQVELFKDINGSDRMIRAKLN